LSDRPLDSPVVSSETWSVPPPRRRFQHQYWRHALLFLLTLVTTTYVGGCHYAGYRVGAGGMPDLFFSDFIPNGFWYSLTLLTILGAHELGHYLMCRYHNVDATLPYFLPVPLPLTGTLGAFIRIREPFPSRRVLFDIGVAGPIAGFVMLVPFLFVGLSWSPPVPAPTDPKDLEFAVSMGEPLLYRLVERLIWGVPPTDWVNLHPMASAAWLGQLVTALNLLPFGQFDGGHISYAVLGRHSTIVSLLTVAAAVGLTFMSANWYLVAGVMVLMLIVFGPRHPSVIHEKEELDAARLLIAIAAVVMFIVCFTPAPLQPYQLLEGPRAR
jgi:membrane-associated protease RseP (regulator of RpoE activity)